MSQTQTQTMRAITCRQPSICSAFLKLIFCLYRREAVHSRVPAAAKAKASPLVSLGKMHASRSNGCRDLLPPPFSSTVIYARPLPSTLDRDDVST